MKRSWQIAVVLIAFLCCTVLAGHACADPIYELTVTGSISVVDPRAGFESDLNSAFSVDDPVSIVLIYNAGTPETFGAPNVDLYNNAIISMSGNVGSLSIGSSGGEPNEISMKNNVFVNGIGGDHIEFNFGSINDETALGSPAGDAAPGNLSFDLADTSNASYPGTGSPPSLASITDFSAFGDSGFATLQFFNINYEPPINPTPGSPTAGSSQVAGDIDFVISGLSFAVVPEPGSLALVVLGGLTLSRRRKM